MSDTPILLFLLPTRAHDAAERIIDHLRSRLAGTFTVQIPEIAPLGSDSRKHTLRLVDQASAVLVCIDEGWHGQHAAGESAPPDNLTRLCLEEALKREALPVIPLTLHGTRLPAAGELPAALSGLVYRQRLEVRRDPSFHMDMETLIAGLRGLLPIPPRFKQPERSPDVTPPPKDDFPGVERSPDLPSAARGESVGAPQRPRRHFAWVVAILLILGLGIAAIATFRPHTPSAEELAKGTDLPMEDGIFRSENGIRLPPGNGAPTLPNGMNATVIVRAGDLGAPSVFMGDEATAGKNFHDQLRDRLRRPPEPAPARGSAPSVQPDERPALCITADEDLPWSQLHPLVAAAQQEGVKTIFFRVKDREEPGDEFTKRGWPYSFANRGAFDRCEAFILLDIREDQTVSSNRALVARGTDDATPKLEPLVAKWRLAPEALGISISAAPQTLYARFIQVAGAALRSKRPVVVNSPTTSFSPLLPTAPAAGTPPLPPQNTNEAAAIDFNAGLMSPAERKLAKLPVSPPALIPSSLPWIRAEQVLDRLRAAAREQRPVVLHFWSQEIPNKGKTCADFLPLLSEAKKTPEAAKVEIITVVTNPTSGETQRLAAYGLLENAYRNGDPNASAMQLNAGLDALNEHIKKSWTAFGKPMVFSGAPQTYLFRADGTIGLYFGYPQPWDVISASFLSAFKQLGSY